MKISIVIPVFNEEKTIASIIDRVKHAPLASPSDGREIIIVDDFSADGTGAILSTVAGPEIKVIRHEKNQGKGAALRTGFARCTGDVVIIQDADLEYNPDEYPLLLGPIVDGDAEVVYGSRFIGAKRHRVLYFWHSMGNYLLTVLSNAFSDLNLTDMETCYKVMTRDVAKRITICENRFGFEPELTAKLAALARNENIRIYEVGISYRGRTYNEGKKIGLKDGFRALYCILKYNSSRLADAVKGFLEGSYAAAIQLALLVALVELAGFVNVAGLNIAHAVSIELSIIASFLLYRHGSTASRGGNFATAMAGFCRLHLLYAIPFVIRCAVFSLLVQRMPWFVCGLISAGIGLLFGLGGFNYLHIVRKRGGAAL